MRREVGELPLGLRADASLTDAQRQAFAVLDAYDLSRVRARLVKEGAIPEATVDEAILEFRRFFGLAIVDPTPFAMFSEEVDAVWHGCVVFTRLYADLCERVCGHFIHHEPTDDPAETAADPRSEWQAFEDAYTRVYGPLGRLWPQPATAEEIADLEAKLSAFSTALSVREQAAFTELLGRAARHDQRGPAFPEHEPA